VSCLYEAGRYGDQLVVAINSDYSVRLLGKADNRPLISEQDRAIVVAALEFVDAVCLFDGSTPIDLINQLEPDVLVKGADYRHEDVVGREVVERRGGRIALVPLLEGYSTTDLVARIRSRLE
jgi:rfaE bifunctional protein nucleotidyltransferase chain/domain